MARAGCGVERANLSAHAREGGQPVLWACVSSPDFGFSREREELKCSDLREWPDRPVQDEPPRDLAEPLEFGLDAIAARDRKLAGEGPRHDEIAGAKPLAEAFELRRQPG